MFEKELMITGVRQQQNTLGHLISQLEIKSHLDDTDGQMYDEVLKQVEKNLKRLRKLKMDYFDALYPFALARN